MEGTSKNGIHRAVFWPAAIIVLVFAALAIIAPEASERAFASVQGTIAAKLGRDDGAWEPRGFLEAYYTQLRARLEANMRMGRRKADKHAGEGE